VLAHAAHNATGGTGHPARRPARPLGSLEMPAAPGRGTLAA
jgi:hypothetical protein